MKSCIHFIRHGITEGILNRWYYGWADMPLTEDGIRALKQLKADGIYPAGEDADFYTSGMIRANQTLEAIYGSAPYRVIDDLREMNFGQWECKTFDELKELEGFDLWLEDKTGDFVFPGGESANAFYQRAGRGLKELLGYHRLKELSHRHSGKDAVSIVACHGGVIAASMCALTDQPKETFWEWIPDPGRGYTVFFENSDPAGYEKI